MFRSRLTLEQYISSLQNDTASADDPSLDDFGDQIQFEEHERDNSNNADIHADLDPSLITIPRDFNDRHEILVIDGDGNASKFKGKITTSSVHTLDYPKRILVPLNKYLQPVKKAGSLFNRFLANVSRRANLCPLDYKEWRVVPDFFKDQIKVYIRRKFLLPPGVEVNNKIIQAVGDKLRGYKYSLRRKYLKDGTPKEELYQLQDRPPGVSDQMWVGFIDHIYSDKFKKFSENGKNARSKHLHSHTKGSQSFAIARDIFVEENHREPGSMEWFVKTHQKKDKTYHDKLTEKFVDSAYTLIKQKTGSSDIEFSESTKEAEAIAYHKLLGHQKTGRIRGYGYGVLASEVNGLRGELRENGLPMSGSSAVSYLLTKLNEVTQHAQLLEQRVDDLQRNNTLASNKANNLFGEKVNDNDVSNEDNAHVETLGSDEETTSTEVMTRAVTHRNVIPKEQVKTQLGFGEKTQFVSQDFLRKSVMKENKNLLHDSGMCTKKSIELPNKNELAKMEKANASEVTPPPTQILKNRFGHNVRVAVEPMLMKVQHHQANEDKETLQQVLGEVTNLKEKENVISNFQLPSSGDPMKEKLKERGRQLRKRKEREEQEMERIRLQFHREEVVASYQELLVETIKDPQASWTESKPELKKDPHGRASNPDLDEADLEKLFHEHVKMLYKVNNLKRVSSQNSKERNKLKFQERSDETQGTHYQARDVFVEKKTSALESSSTQVGAKSHLVKTKVNLSANEIESVVDKVMKENMSFVQKYRHGTRQEFISYYLTGTVIAHAQRRGKVDPELVDEILLKKLRKDNN